MGQTGSSVSIVHDYSGPLSGNSGIISINQGDLSGGGSTASSDCHLKPAIINMGTVNVANATGSPVHLYFKKEKMNTSELIQGTSLIRCDGVGSIVIEPGSHVQCPVVEDLYVTGFHVIPNQPFDCPSGKPLFENLLAENACGEHKSCIITTSVVVKFAKKGEIWVDQSGEDLKPKA